MGIEGYKEYLDYLTGIPIKLIPNHDNKFKKWVNQENKIILELSVNDNTLYIHKEIWNDFSVFFNLSSLDTKKILLIYFYQHVNQFFTPVKNTWGRQRGWGCKDD